MITHDGKVYELVPFKGGIEKNICSGCAFDRDDACLKAEANACMADENSDKVWKEKEQ